MNKGEKLQCCFKRKGIKKKYVAEKMGISVQSLSNKIKGINDFSWTDIHNLLTNNIIDYDELNDIFFRD